ncbi:metallophosphoesterase [Virgibacillus xinjiangensis]|uniref:Metallophosphoesterase n=1 Tax=Virgibacillus xinjiangensis TaxID=393090 RepID=A0ABV7CQF4_9BACI
MKKLTRRSFIKKAAGSLLAMAGLGGGTYYYAREIEPYLLQVNEEDISLPTISPAFDQFRIIQFSDTHIGFHYDIQQFQKLVKKINELEPDLIVFTGDLVDKPHRYDWNENLTNALRKLQAPFGKYWVYGNHDHGGYGTDKLAEVMESADFQLLQNSHTVIEKEAERFILAGIDDVVLGRPDISESLQQVNPELFTVMLAHEPDIADVVAEFPVDVQLSGHSHGGQVQLPFIGHLYTPAFAEKYVEGRYNIPHHQLSLYVSRGIGTTRLPYRFLCKPEIHVYSLNSSSSAKLS